MNIKIFIKNKKNQSVLYKFLAAILSSFLILVTPFIFESEQVVKILLIYTITTFLVNFYRSYLEQFFLRNAEIIRSFSFELVIVIIYILALYYSDNLDSYFDLIFFSVSMLVLIHFNFNGVLSVYSKKFGKNFLYSNLSMIVFYFQLLLIYIFPSTLFLFLFLVLLCLVVSRYFTYLNQEKIIFNLVILNFFKQSTIPTILYISGINLSADDFIMLVFLHRLFVFGSIFLAGYNNFYLSDLKSSNSASEFLASYVKNNTLLFVVAILVSISIYLVDYFEFIQKLYSIFVAVNVELFCFAVFVHIASGPVVYLAIRFILFKYVVIFFVMSFFFFSFLVFSSDDLNQTINIFSSYLLLVNILPFVYFKIFNK